MLQHGAPYQIVLGSVIVDNRKRDHHGTVHAISIHIPEELIGGIRTKAVPCLPHVRVGIEDPESVSHDGSAAMTASVIPAVVKEPRMSAVRESGLLKTARTAA